METKKSTNFYAKIPILFIFLFFLSVYAKAQTFDPIPEQCNTGAIIDLYDYTDPDGGTFSIIPGATPGLSGHTFDPSAAGVGSYTIRWTHSNVGPGHIDRTVDVVGNPAAPTAITSSPDKFCADQGGNIQLSVTGGSGTILHWYDDFPGGHEVGTGTPLTITAPVSSTTFYAVYENACGISLDYNYQVIVYQVTAADMAINGIDSPYCSDAADDIVDGLPNDGYLTKVFTPAVAGITDHGDGTCTISPTTLGTGNYNLTYTVTKDNCTHTITEPFTVNPPLVVSFSGLHSPVCIDWGNQTLTGSEAPNGTFSGPGITDNGNGTAIFDPSGAGAGTHTITYSYTDAFSCTATSQQTVVVNALPSLGFLTLDPDYCEGDPVEVLTGSEAPNGTYSVTPAFSGFTDNGDGTADFDPIVGGAGTYQVVYVYTDGNTCTGRASRTTEVHAILTPTITGNANPCQNLDITYTTEAGMNNYVWIKSAGGTIISGGTGTDNSITINWSATGAQTVSVTYDDSNGGCTSNTVTKNITVKAQPTATLNPFSNVCLQDPAFVLSGGSGSPAGGTGVYDVDGTVRVNFDPSVEGVGAHTITYTYTNAAPNSCSNSASQAITVLDLNASVGSLDASYCKFHADKTIVGNNTDGGIGSFSIAPAPINAAMFVDNGNNTATLSPANCAAGDYNVTFTVTYSYTNGTCSAQDQTATFIYGQPTVTINGLSGTYCTDDAVDLFTGTPANGTFSTTAPAASLTDDGAGNGSFTPGTAGAGAYTISYYYSDASGCDNTDIQNVSVNQTPDVILASSDADNTICDGVSVTFTATDNEGVADTYEFFVDGVSVQGPGAGNTYVTTSLNNGETVKVNASVAASSCNDLSTGITTTVIAAPTPTISGKATACEDEAGVVYATEAAMNNYSWTIAGGTITAGAGTNTVTVTWNTPGVQSISVNYENGNACSAASPTAYSVTVVALPDDALAVSDDEICVGETALITLSSSDLGVTYQLRKDSDDSPVGSAYNGTGGDINMPISPGPITTTLYNILASNSTGCSIELTDKSTLTVNPLPVPVLSSSDADNAICQGESVTFTATGGDEYEFFVDGNTVQGPVATTTYTTTSLTDGQTVTVDVTNTTTTCNKISAGITTTVHALPSPTLSGKQSVCLNESGVVYATDAGMSNYSWSIIGGTITSGGTVNDATATVTWTSVGTQSISVNYDNANSCTAVAATGLAVTVNALPDYTLAVSDDEICIGETATITLSSSVAGVTYQLRKDIDDTPVGAALNGTGGDLNFSASPLATTTYNILASNANACTNELLDKPVVTVNPLPVAGLSSSDADNTICDGESVTFTASGGDEYEFYVDGISVQGPGANAAYTTTSLSDGETVTVDVTNTTTSCSNTSAGITTTVNALPSPSLSGDQDVCLNESGVIYTTDAGMSNYGWNVVGGTVTAGGTANDNHITLTWNSAGVQSVSVNYDNANGCNANSSTSLAVTVNDLPNDSYSLSNPVIICLGNTATITQSGSELGINYQLRKDSDNSLVGSAVAGTGNAITFDVSPLTNTSYNVLATNNTTTCNTEITNISSVIVNALPDETLAINGSAICYGEAGTIVLQSSEAGVSYQLRLDTDDSNQGVALVGTGGDLTFYVAPLSTTTYNILATNGNSCFIEMATKPVVTVNDLPDNTLNFGDDEICFGETASLILYNSAVGVSYQLRLDSDNSLIGAAQNGSGGNLQFNVSPVNSTTYNLLATNGNNCSNEIIDKGIVIVNALPDNTLAVSSPSVCTGATATITLSASVVGVTYQLRLDSDDSNVGSAVPGNGMDITFSVSPASTTVYNIMATNSTSCTSELVNKSTVTIYDSPNENLIVDDDEICYGQTANVVLYGSEVGVTYQLRLDSDNSNVGTAIAGTGGNISFSVSPNSTTIYNVYAYNGNACAVELLDKTTVTVNPLPDVTLTLGDDQICLGETADISLFNSVLGVHYQLRLDSDNSNVGSVQTGNGGTLVFHDAPASTTTYNMLAYDVNSCAAELNDKAIVQVFPLANSTLTVSDPIICIGENGVVSVDNSETGVSYQLRLDSDNSTVGAAVPGNGGSITFDVSPLTTTLFNVLATTANSCDVELDDRALVTVNPTPDETLAVNSPSICNGETAEIVVYTSEVGVTYQLRLDIDNTTVGVPVAGNGGDISFFVNPIATTTYNILATGGNTCSIEMAQKSTVTVYPLPDITLIVDDPTICNGETASIVLQSSEVGVNYQLRLNSNNSAVGAVQVGTGANLTFDVNPSVSTIYNIYATTPNACGDQLSDKAVVTVLPSPDLTLDLSDDEICVGNMASIILSNSTLGVSYQLRLNIDNSLVGSPVVGTGFDIQFDVAPIATTVYNVLATNSNACTGTLTDISTVVVHDLPAKPIITAGGPTTFCDGGNVDLTSSFSDSYLWSGGETTQTINVTSAGTYTVTVTDANTCESPVSDPIIVTVNPLPIVNFSGLNAHYCHDEAASILTGDPIPNALTTGVFAGNGITDNGDGTAIFDPVAAGIGGPYTITYTYTNENTCTDVSTQTTTVFTPPSITFSGLDAEYCVDASPILITGSEAPLGSFSGVGITDNNNGTATFTPSIAGVGGPYNISYTFTNADGCTNTYISQTTVNELPTVTFGTLNSEYCVDHAVVLITGNHAPEGSFSGVGLFDNGDGTAIFDPSAAGVGGPYDISYTYSDGNTCTNTAVQQTIIHPLPTVNFSGLATDYCIDATPTTLVGNHAPGGTFTGLGVTNHGDGTATFDPSAAGAGMNIDITYAFSDGNFCSSSQTKQVNVHALPIVSIAGLDANYCVNDDAITILGSPTPDVNTNGFFTGNGLTDNGDGSALFSPNTLVAGNIYTITYTFQDTNTCVDTYAQDVNIIDLPAPPVANDVAVCFGETVPDLTATGEPGFQLVWYNSAGDSVYSGNTYPTGITAVGVYDFSVTQIHTVTTCESDHTPVSLTIKELPTVALPAFDDVCIYDFIIYLNSGTPAGGVYSGDPGILQLPNGDYIFHPEYAGAGLHTIIYTYQDPLTTCSDTAMSSIRVHDRPDVEILDLASVYCVSGNEVTINGNHPGAGSFSGPGITDNGDGTALFNPSLAGLGSKSIIYEYADPITTCINQDTAVTVVEGAPENVAYIQISDPEICADAGGTVTLQAFGGSGTWVNWFENSCGGSHPEILSATADSSLIVINAPTTSTYYFAQWETECGVSDLCADNYIVVNQLPTVPDTAWASPHIVCPEDLDDIALFITGGNYGTTLVWTQDSCTGVVVGQSNGDPVFIPTPDTTTEYFAHWENTCGISSCSEKVRVSVIRPAEEVALADADSNFFCRNVLASLQLRSFGGRGDTVIWYYDSLGLYPVPADSLISANQPGDTIVIIPPTISTIYYPFRATPCEQVGGDVSVSISVFGEPIAPDSSYTLPSVICFGATDSITLVAEGGGGANLEWYSGSCENGVFLGTGNNFKVYPPNNTTAYFAKWTTPCGISDCAETEMVVYPSTSDPEMMVSDTNEICAGNLSDIQLVVVGGSGDSVVWFADACGGVQLDPNSFYYQSAMRDTIVIPAPITDTTFYAYWATPCEASACVSLEVTVFPQPVMMDTIYSDYNNFCSGSVPEITLTTQGGSGTVISWTKDSCNGPVIATTTVNSITIPSPSDTTTYFAKWKTVCDSTECQSIQINVPQTPTNPTDILLQESLICDNVVDSITLYLEGGSGWKAIWFYGPYCGNDTIPDSAIHYLSANGDSIRIARPAQTQTITANWASFEGYCGSSDCVSTDVFVYYAPSADFSIVGGNECQNALLQFSPNSMAGSGLITNLNWNFDDGNVVDTNLQVDIFHAYENQGDYIVQLIVSNTFGCQDTTWKPLTISEAPIAAFSYESSCVSEPVLFSDESQSAVDSISAWMWHFNDPGSISDTSSMQNPSYSFSQPGIYHVSLTITDSTGCTDMVVQDVVIAPSPTAYFTLETSSCQDVPVFFNDSSFTENNMIGTWIWNFGDGSNDSTITYPNSPDVMYTYHSNGLYTVSLTVVDTSGCVGETFYRYFEVRPTPLAGFLYSDTACQTGIIHFFDTTYHEPGTNGVAWQWSFGDGSVSFDQNPVHSYIETGQSYDVQMIIVDDYGCRDSISQAVEVKPELEISFASDLACENSATQLIAHLIQPENEQVSQWQWHFGDGTDTIVHTDTVYHVYPSGGTFYATLSGQDEGGCEAIVINQAVHVNYAPEVDFYIPQASCEDPSVFYDHSVPMADSVILYYFDFGDGTYITYHPSDYPNPVNHIYPAGSNEYIATITLTNSNGCETTQEFAVARESCISMEFAHTSPACIGKPVRFINLSAINNADVTVDSIFWNFGDGVIYQLPIEEGDTVYHSYTDGGLQSVQMQLKANNASGDFITSVVKNIFVNETPTAGFQVSAQLLCSRDSLQFEDKSWMFDGEIALWEWNFDDASSDGDTSNLQNPAYWYAYEGDYSPSLIAVSDSGCRDTAFTAISLHPSPVNHLFANTEFGCGINNEIFLRDTAYLSSGSINQYKWIFGFNDTVYTEVDSLRHDLSLGEYTIISQVTSDLGCIGTDSISGYHVYDQPFADFGYYPEDPTITEPEVYFNDKSIAQQVPIEYYHWNFGDGRDTVGLDPVHIYQDTGAFHVILTIQDENGCVDTASLQVYVDPVFSFFIPNAFSPNGNGLNDEFGPIGAYFEDSNYEFEVYSRWGELLFETRDPFGKWKGDYALSTQKTVPLGVYSWIIRVKDALGDEHVYKGQVTVVR